MKKLLPAILMSLCLSAAHGEFTYVDATPTNTTVNGTAIVLAPDGGFNVDTANNGTDNLWSYRTATGWEGGAYFDTDTQPNTDETTDPLVTTITLPVAGTYDIVVVNGANVAPRDISIKIGSAPADTNADNFLDTEVISADQAANPPLVDFDATFTNARGASGRAAYVGKVTTTSANETIQVYINGFETTASTTDDERTIYEGVGYQLIDPAAPKFTYVDATAANTTLNGAALVDRNADPTNGNYFAQVNTDLATIGTGTDGFWTFRNLTGYEDGNYFESDNVSSGGDAETTPDLITTVNLPTPGVYQVVALFTQSNTRDIAARIASTPGSGNVFTTANALTVNQTTFPRDVNFDSSYTNSRGSNGGGANLGTVVTTSPNEAVQIFVNGLIGTSGTQDERTQYDGIGYRLIQEGISSKDSIVGELQGTGTLGYFPNSTNNTVGIAGASPNRRDHNVVLGYVLPTLPVGETVDSVNFFFEIVNATGTVPDLQVYLLDTTNPDSSGTSLFFHGTAGSTDPSSAVELVNTTSVTGTGDFADDTEDRTFTLTGDALALIQSFYGGDHVPDRPEVFFRFSLADNPLETTLVRYLIDFADNESGIAINPPPAGNTFATWISGFDVGALDGVGDDADGDGTDNAVENIFGTEPDAFSQGLLAGTQSGNTFTFTHPQNATPASDLTPAYKWSTDLANWYLGDGIASPGGGLTVTATPNTVSGTTTVTATASQSLPKLFLRVEVTQD